MKMPREMILEKKAQTKEHGYSLSLIRKSSFRQEYCLTSQCEKLQNTFMSSTIQRRRFEKAAGRAEDFLNDNLVYGRWDSMHKFTLILIVENNLLLSEKCYAYIGQNYL